MRLNKEYSMNKPGCIANWSRGGAVGGDYYRGYDLREEKWAMAVNQASVRFLRSRQPVPFRSVMTDAEMEPRRSGFYPFVQQCISSNAVKFDGYIQGLADVGFRAKTLNVISPQVIEETTMLFRSYVPLPVVPRGPAIDSMNQRLLAVQRTYGQSVEDRMPHFGRSPPDARHGSPPGRSKSPRPPSDP
jgi:hypothetical protein